jgi:hypothetical protein
MRLKHTSIAIATYTTSTWNTSKIRLKHLKHLKHRLLMCVYCHCNICNISDILLQHPDETHETKVWNTLNILNTTSLVDKAYLMGNCDSQPARVSATSLPPLAPVGVAHRSSCDSPAHARGLGLHLSARPRCCYSSANVRSAVVVQRSSLVGDEERRGQRWGAAR